MRRWIDRAREVAREYRANARELEQCKHGTVRGDEQWVISRRLDYLERATAAYEFAVDGVADKPDGYLTIKMVDMIYADKTHTLAGAALALHLSERTARRYHRYFLKLVAISMGFIGRRPR